MTENQKIATRVFVLWAAVVAFVFVSVLMVRGCVFRTARAIVGAAGPGNSDYEMDIIADFELLRTHKNARSIFSKSQNTIWIDEDVTRLGWDSRFIVCIQNGTSWWVIDTVTVSKYGPLDESGCATKLREFGIEPPQLYPTPEGSGSPVDFGPGELHNRKLQ